MPSCALVFSFLCLHGIASWYGPGFDGEIAANGKPFHQEEMTAASRTLPLGTVIMVENVSNHRVVVVRVTDRGPYADMEHRILDLSMAAAKRLGFIEKGTARVEVAVVDTP